MSKDRNCQTTGIICTMSHLPYSTLAQTGFTCASSAACYYLQTVDTVHLVQRRHSFGPKRTVQQHTLPPANACIGIPATRSRGCGGWGVGEGGPESIAHIFHTVLASRSLSLPASMPMMALQLVGVFLRCVRRRYPPNPLAEDRQRLTHPNDAGRDLFPTQVAQNKSRLSRQPSPPPPPLAQECLLTHFPLLLSETRFQKATGPHGGRFRTARAQRQLLCCLSREHP